MSVMPQAIKTLIFALLVTTMFSIVASVARANILPDGTPEEQYNYAKVILGKWCPGAGFDALLQGYQQPDFQLYQ